MAFSGALVKKTADQTTANYSTGDGVVMAFDAEVYDVGTWHDTVTNNSRLTVPSGVTRIRLNGHVSTSNYASGAPSKIDFLKNGAVIGSPDCVMGCNHFNGQCSTQAISPVLEVTTGDYFELRFHTTDTSITITAANTCFFIEAVDDPQPTYSGALVKPSVDLTTVNLTSAYHIPFNTEIDDTGGWHDNVTNNTRLTVPSGVSYVRLTGQADFDSTDGWRNLIIFKNGALLTPCTFQDSSTNPFQIRSYTIAVTTGDYFTLFLSHSTDNSATIYADGTWFSIEKVE